jgi:hypothetical protein
MAVVFRRGPAAWWHIGRWDLTNGDYESGAWLRGRVYPRRCDVSPDGNLLLTFIAKTTAAGFPRPDDPAQYDTYITLSRPPWLHAVAAWREGSTWGRGWCFGSDPGVSMLGAPDFGSTDGLNLWVDRYPSVQYAVERRRGWVEYADSPIRDEGDVWDQHRSAVLTKPDPLGAFHLILRDHGRKASDDGAIESRRPTYEVHGGDEVRELRGVVWADWDKAGRLLVATDSGTIEIRELDGRVAEGRVVRSHDLATLRPSPQPPPESAKS